MPGAGCTAEVVVVEPEVTETTDLSSCRSRHLRARLDPVTACEATTPGLSPAWEATVEVEAGEEEVEEVVEVTTTVMMMLPAMEEDVEGWEGEEVEVAPLSA